MNAFRAIYKLTLRAAMREKVAWSMLVLVIGTQILLPLGLRGDGTLSGELRMHIRYSIGLSSLLLAGMTLWISCAAVSGDLSTKRLQMVLTKPVSRAAVWWGKWLAVSTLSVSLLFLCGAVTLHRVYQTVRTADDPDPEIHQTLLTARRAVQADPVDLSQQIEEMFADVVRTGRFAPGVTEEMVRTELGFMAQAQRHAATAGESVSWNFTFPAPIGHETDLQLAYLFDGASMGAARIPGRWRIESPELNTAYTEEILDPPAGEHTLYINPDGRFRGARSLTVTFDNLSEREDMVFFRPETGIVLYQPHGAFAPNLFRALLLLAGLLSLLAALGVSAGSLFSLPVACYATAMTLIMRGFGDTVDQALREGTTLSRSPDQSLLLRAFNTFNHWVYRFVDLILKPLDINRPLDRVASGVLISGGEVLHTLFFRMTPVLLLIALAGILLFHQRETGVAE